MNTTPHAETPVTILHRQGDAFVAVSRNLVVVRWTSIPTGDQLAALAHAHRLATGTGAEVLLVNHVARIARPPSVGGELYTRILELVRACDGPTRAVAHVIEVPGRSAPSSARSSPRSSGSRATATPAPRRTRPPRPRSRGSRASRRARPGTPRRSPPRGARWSAPTGRSLRERGGHHALPSQSSSRPFGAPKRKYIVKVGLSVSCTT